MAFESYELASPDVGSFLSSRYKNSSIQGMTMAYDGTAGSVLVLVER